MLKTISPMHDESQERERLEAEMRERGLLREPDPEPADGYAKADLSVLDGIKIRPRPR